MLMFPIILICKEIKWTIQVNSAEVNTYEII